MIWHAKQRFRDGLCMFGAEAEQKESDLVAAFWLQPTASLPMIFPTSGGPFRLENGMSPTSGSLSLERTMNMN